MQDPPIHGKDRDHGWDVAERDVVPFQLAHELHLAARSIVPEEQCWGNAAINILEATGLDLQADEAAVCQGVHGVWTGKVRHVLVDTGGPARKQAPATGVGRIRMSHRKNFTYGPVAIITEDHGTSQHKTIQHEHCLMLIGTCIQLSDICMGMGDHGKQCVQEWMASIDAMPDAAPADNAQNDQLQADSDAILHVQGIREAKLTLFVGCLWVIELLPDAVLKQHDHHGVPHELLLHDECVLLCGSYVQHLLQGSIQVHRLQASKLLRLRIQYKAAAVMQAFKRQALAVADTARAFHATSTMDLCSSRRGTVKEHNRSSVPITCSDEARHCKCTAS